MKCVDKCELIELNVSNVEVFDLKCIKQDDDIYSYQYGNVNDYSQLCRDLAIDASYANTVNIDVESFPSSTIYALKASNFSFTCKGPISDVNLFVPSSSSFYFYHTFSTSINIYSDDKLNHIENVNYIVCDNPNVDTQISWTLYYPSFIRNYDDANNYDGRIVSSLPCQSNTFLQQTYCKYDEYGTKKALFVTANVTYDPWLDDCRHIDEPSWLLFQEMVNWILWIIFGIIMIYWLFIFGRQMFFKYSNPIKYNEIKNIEPPSFGLLFYLYSCDIFIWIVQIYIVVIMSNTYNYYRYDICESPGRREENYVLDEFHCLRQSC